jgi:hypothetical protein
MLLSPEISFLSALFALLQFLVISKENNKIGEQKQALIVMLLI